jgi:arylsulfatase A-like enzyme
MPLHPSTLPVSRRTALTALASGAAMLGKPSSRPNFLFILADDHAGYVLGCDGNKLASTPNIDRLASQGTRFAAHYCNSPVCTPSRQGLLTGMLPHAAGVTLLSTPLAPDKQTLARQFQQAGYRTSVFGKMHFNRRGEPGLHGFDNLLTEGELKDAWTRDVPPSALPAGASVKPVWRPFQDPARIWLNADQLPFPRIEREMKGYYLASRAINHLENHRDNAGSDPFALWVSFQEPHSPFDFPVGDESRFARSRFQAPEVGPHDEWQIPLIFRGLSPQDKQGIIASYYTSVAYLDRNVGRVLSAVKRLGLDENTIVIYTADHGYSLGQHGRFEKHCGYDPALRVPLIVRWPGRVGTRVITEFTEHVDLSATIPDLTGISPLPVSHGQSLRPYLEGGKMAAPRDHIFSEYLENEEAYVRSHDWKFILCSGRRARKDGYQTDRPTPGRYRLLYDLRKDPGEFRDVAAAHPDVVEQMEGLLLNRFRQTHPDRVNEPPRLPRADAIEFYLRPRDAQ